MITNLEATLAKNMSHNLQAVVSLTRQWDSLRGTFNPTDPATLRVQLGAGAGVVFGLPQSAAVAVARTGI